jgi:large subunit ribosomal protein L13
MKTTMQKTAQVVRNWHLIDAKGRILGQVATEVATLLIGKHKPTYTPHIDAGDYVVVINAASVATTGKKEQDKMYYRHSGQPGGFKEENLASLRQRAPERVIEYAVKGMLPKNKLQQPRLLRLKVFRDDQHTYADKLKAE